MVDSEESAVFYTARKWRLACARALPEAEAAKPGGANRTTEITSYAFAFF
jgi:hypothetical protein